MVKCFHCEGTLYNHAGVYRCNKCGCEYLSTKQIVERLCISLNTNNSEKTFEEHKKDCPNCNSTNPEKKKE